ncbi:MAG: NUDIX hydrolase [Longimicrobiales bacterium]
MAAPGGGVNKRAGSKKAVERSAGGVVVRLEEPEWKVLIIRDPYGNWGLPKGHIEGSETEEQAAVREVEEETGLTSDALGPLVERIDWFFRKNSVVIHKFCSFYLMRSDTGIPVPQADEGITECDWATFDDAASRIAYDNTKGVVRKAKGLLQTVGW